MSSQQFARCSSISSTARPTAAVEARMSDTVNLPIPHCAQCLMLIRLLSEARDRIPDWQTGVNKELLAEIDAVLSSIKTRGET
jgi:hypothetical protein